jgi:hypothetical protein
MTSSARDIVIPCAVSAKVTSDSLIVELDDGRTISAPVSWYPRLHHATASERANLRFTGRGEGIRWDEIDEDISIDSLLAGRASQESQDSLAKWLKGRKKI